MYKVELRVVLDRVIEYKEHRESASSKKVKRKFLYSKYKNVKKDYTYIYWRNCCKNEKFIKTIYKLNEKC